MSTEPATRAPAYDTTNIKTPVDRKRSIPRRIARITLRLLGGVVALVVLLVIFLHTPWGKSVVRGRIESRLGAMVNGEVSLGSLDYGFLFSSVELGELEIRDATGKRAIRIGSLAVTLDRGSLLDGTPNLEEVALAGVDVNLVRNADGTSNLTGLFKPSDRKPMKQITVGKLTVAGAVTITKPDGSTIAIKDLGVSGSILAKPAIKEVSAAITHIGAQVDLTSATGTKHVAVSLDNIKLDRGLDAIDVDIEKLAIGAVGIDKVAAHVKLVDGKPRGEQKITFGKAHVDNKQLAELIGKDLLLDNVALDLSITGPENKLVIAGAVRTGGATLTVGGTADISKAVPSYAVAITGKGRTTSVLKPQPDKKLIDVQTDIRVDIKGSGVSPLDLDAEVILAIGPTMIGQIALDGVNAKVFAKRGAYKLESLTARGVELQVEATADVRADKSMTGTLHVTGSPAKAMKVLAAAGIAVPKKAPLVDKLDMVVHASGKLDGEIAINLEPTKIPLAGGTVSLVGSATLHNKQLSNATTKIQLAGLDLGSLAQLAGRPPKVHGSLSGTVGIDKTATTRDATYNVAIALRDQPLTIHARGAAGADSATARGEVRRRGDNVVLAVLDAKIPLDAQGFQPAGPWKLVVDVANRQLAEIAALLPAHLREKLPAGTVEIHADLSGSPARPTGTITIAADAAALKSIPNRQKVALRAVLSPTAKGLNVATTGSVALEGLGEVATIGGTISMPFAFVNKKPDVAALRAGLVVDSTIDITERPLASLASFKAKLAELGGTVGGRIAVRGPVKAIALDAKIDWNGYRTAAGTTGKTQITAVGTPKVFTATVNHNGPLSIVADIDRSDAERIAVHARMTAPESPLLPLLPAFLAEKIGLHDLGKLRANLDAKLVLAKTETGMALAQAIVTGGLDVTRGAILIPGSKRRYHDVTLAIAGEPNGVRIKQLSLRESDIENKDRRIDISGLLSLDKARPTQASLSLVARDWLVFGGDRFGQADAPRASASFDIAVKADLASPIIGVDATVKSLSFRVPERFDRAHNVEKMNVGGDIIFTSSKPTGRLPIVAVAPVAIVAEPAKKRPMDIRVHIPKAIRLEQTPMDLMARGDVTLTIRDDGTKVRGKLTIERGKLSLFGRDHALVDGSLTFSEQYPSGHMALTFEHHLPDVVMRELSKKHGGPRVSFAGSPSKPKTTLHGAANAALLEVMALYNGGRPLNVSRPGLPASTTVQAPRGDQMMMLTFIATNLPHLLFLDRINAWADPYQGANAYGRITNMEAEKYTKTGNTRVKAVVRPNQPGRSNTEVQVDRMMINNDRTAVGVGLRAGDRGGGGVGVFVEWSSKE